MDPKRLEKLQIIQDWEAKKPTKDSEWTEDVKAESLDVKYDHQLEEMLDSHASKVEKVEKDLAMFADWPSVKRYELTRQFAPMFKDQGDPAEIEGKTLKQWIDEEYESQELYYTWKVAKLNQSVERIAKEIELRVTGYLEVKEEKLKGTLPQGGTIRIPIGTTYYIDPVNGTDTFAGTRIDSTVDSTALETVFIDDALTGADDYILNSYFYNVTRGMGSLITDFVAATDTVTLAGAITGMAAGDTYYILNAWLDLDQFTENARSAGDKVIIRRGANQCDDGTDLNFTSDGTIASPIIIEADFDNLWRDQVDLSVTATATLTFGSKTVTYASDISGVLAAGDWIYASGDNNKEFAYEVASVSTVTATLYLPYKGNQAGSGKTTYNLQDNPIWNTAAGDFQWNFDTDFYWRVQGIHIRGTDANGNAEIDSCDGQEFMDCIFEGNAGGDKGIEISDDPVGLNSAVKCRFYNHVSSYGFGNGTDATGHIVVRESLFNGNSVASNRGIALYNGSRLTAYDLESSGYSTAGDIQINGGNLIRIRNSKLNSSPQVDVSGINEIFIEDYENIPGDNRLQNYIKSADLTTSQFLIQPETTIVRSGGSNKSIKVTPTANLSTNWGFSKLMVFEIPIYATTDSKTYTVYFRPSATGDWADDPTASELWIELEAWGHATNNFRKITKSTGVIDMNGSTAWQALTVTVAPAQVGVAYLRCYYAKTGTSVFYCDPLPVIS